MSGVLPSPWQFFRVSKEVEPHRVEFYPAAMFQRVPRGDEDKRLQDFCGAMDCDGAQGALDRLFVATIQPQIRRCVAFLTRDPDERESLHALVAHRLVIRLRRLRSDPNSPSITDLDAYTAVAVRHAHDHWLQRRFPNRHRLKMRLRYLLRHADGLALWEQDSRLVAGLAAWQSQNRPVVAPDETDETTWEGRSPREGCRRLLQQTGGPVALDDLVDVAARALGVTDSPEIAFDDAAEHPDIVTDWARHWAQRALLEATWSQVRQLPQRQAAALLLNLRDGQGHGVVELLLVQGIAGRDEIGRALGQEGADWETLWDELPLDDNRIAALLGVTRQQVINLRKVARERLERRMRKEGMVIS